MSALAFLPWLRLSARVDTSAFGLLPYRRGQEPGGVGSEAQRAIDQVLLPYHQARSAPIDRATVMQVAGEDLTADLTDDQVALTLAWGQLVAFAGLSLRRFFAHLGYTNRDCYQLIVQRFSDPGGGTLLLNRRRDGSDWTAVSKGALLVMKPHHVAITQNGTMDGQLLQALLARAGSPDWGELEEAILGFNSANSDSPDVRDESEIVALVGALERVLSLKGGDEDELANAFEATLVPADPWLPDDCERIRGSPLGHRFAVLPSLRNAWIRDLVRLRHGYAHGKLNSQYPSVWQLREHLLFATFAFPLVVKRRLANEGFYSLTGADRSAINAFEELVCAQHFAERAEEDVHPWNDIIGRVQIADYIERVAAEARSTAANKPEAGN